MKRLISIILAAMMMATVVLIPVSAANNEITTPGGSGPTKAELAYGTDANGDDVVDHGTNFKVTVTTVIPFTVDKVAAAHS